MKIRFIKNHCEYIAGVTVDNHPNAAYLITLGVAVGVTEEIKKPKKEKK